MKLTLVKGHLENTDPNTLYLDSSSNLAQVIKAFQQNTFQSIESLVSLTEGLQLNDKDLWKNVFSALNENGDLNLKLGVQMTSEHQAEVASLMKINGFANLHISENLIQAKKPQWQAAGAPLKRKQQQQIQQQNQPTQSNPWASLVQQNDANLINEDELMKDTTANGQTFQKFCGEDDGIKAGRPCENCTCGRKELEEGRVTQKDLEVGNVESNCGKCYLGDAFRCASCPYLGQPAFEPGDKVQLKNAGNTQQQVESEQIQVKTTGNRVVLDL